MDTREKDTFQITVSRQLGSGGAYIARKVAAELGLRYVDRDVVRRATEYLGSEEESMVFREERVSGFVEDILRGYIYGTPEAAYVPPPFRPIYDVELFEAEAEIIRRIAERYDAVIVGRAGFHVLKHRPGVINVFLHAPMEARIERIREIYQISDPRKAAEMIRESDENRGKFIDAVAGVNWTDARCYHLSLDTAACGLAGAGEMILKLVSMMRPTT